MIATDPQAGAGAPRSIAEALGQIVWLLSQSPMHREMPIKALDTTFMPALAVSQFRLFRFGPLEAFGNGDPAAFARLGLSREALEQLPLGVAIWANLTEEAEAKVERKEPLLPAEWNGGDRLWLLELLSPFATSDNKLVELMIADLMAGPFAGRRFRLHRVNPAGQRETVVIEPQATDPGSVSIDAAE